MKTLSLDRLPSPLGTLVLVVDDDDHVVALEFEMARIHRSLKRCSWVERPAPCSIRHAIEAYFEGTLHALDAISVSIAGTEFERKVWLGLRSIPPGETTSYGALAETLGSPSAARAVGRANGANPIALVLPCHRVIGRDGSLTGYAGGIERKRWLLDHEARACQSAARPANRYSSSTASDRPIAGISARSPGP
jgi:methylated-DNA-[protein]-cysteine S-methyltransferase